eukprot:350561-Chlamydomonas_euryale.AAC.11
MPQQASGLAADCARTREKASAASHRVRSCRSRCGRCFGPPTCARIRTQVGNSSPESSRRAGRPTCRMIDASLPAEAAHRT